jgi:hypothetical protein
MDTGPDRSCSHRADESIRERPYSRVWCDGTLALTRLGRLEQLATRHLDVCLTGERVRAHAQQEVGTGSSLALRPIPNPVTERPVSEGAAFYQPA